MPNSQKAEIRKSPKPLAAGKISPPNLTTLQIWTPASQEALRKSRAVQILENPDTVAKDSSTSRNAVNERDANHVVCISMDNPTKKKLGASKVKQISQQEPLDILERETEQVMMHIGIITG